MLVLALYFCRAEVVPWLQAAGSAGRHVEQQELWDRLQPAHYRGSHGGRVGHGRYAGHYHEGQRWRGGLTSHLLDGHKLDTKRLDSSSPDWSSCFMLPSQCYTALLSKPMSPCLYKTPIGHLQTAKVSLSFCIWCAVIWWLITRQARETLVGTNLPTKNQPMICRCIIDTVYRSEN